MNLGSRVARGWFKSGSSDNECARKRIIEITASGSPLCPDAHWMDVEHLAQIEVSSEDPAAPIETVFHFGRGPGWRAAKSGTQRIQLIFDQPQHLGAYGCDLLKLRPSARRNSPCAIANSGDQP